MRSETITIENSDHPKEVAFKFLKVLHKLRIKADSQKTPESEDTEFTISVEEK